MKTKRGKKIVFVKGYVRKDGVVIPDHYRSTPN